MGLRGGGKVIKKVIKTKATETTVQSDRVLFEQSFSAAVAIHTFTDINIKDSLLKMDLGKLKELYVYLKHDRTVATMKVEKFCDSLPEGIALDKAQRMINSAMDRLRIMTVTSMEQEDGTFDLKSLLELVSNRIAGADAIKGSNSTTAAVDVREHGFTVQAPLEGGNDPDRVEQAWFCVKRFDAGQHPAGPRDGVDAEGGL